MKTVWDYVQVYIALGWVVVPCPAGVKHPVIPWKKYQTERPTYEQYESWFKDTTCNIALVTGALSQVMVLDLDSYKEAFKEVNIHSSVQSVTARGGRHLFFKYNPQFSNSVSSTTAIDIRGEGGLIVLPPSVFASGHYAWADEGADFKNLPVLSDEGIMQGRGAESAPFVLQDTLEVVAGERNAQFFKLCCHLIRTFRDDAKTAYYFARLAGSDYRPALSMTDIRTTFKSAHKNVSENKEQDYTIGAVREPAPKRKVITTAEAIIEGAVMQGKIEACPALGVPVFDDFIKMIPGELYLISAETHVGKTLFSMQMALADARRNKKKILYISLENGPHIITTLIEIYKTIPESMYWYFPSEIITFKEITEALEEQEFDSVYIDHLHFTRMENGRTMGETINEMVLQLQMLARRKNIPIVAICHLRKSQTSKDGARPTLSDLKDTSALAQIPSVVMLIWRKKSEELGASYLENNGIVIIAKNRFGKTGDIPFVLENKQFCFDKSKYDIPSGNDQTGAQLSMIDPDLPF